MSVVLVEVGSFVGVSEVFFLVLLFIVCTAVAAS